jgi:phosphatidylglycerophosphatase A
MEQNYPRSIWRNPIHFLAFGFGTGTIPFAPGTFGTLIAIPLYLVLTHFPLWLYGIILIIGFLFGCWICANTEHALNQKDPPGIVWDEIIGFWATMFAVPVGFFWIVLGFILFRLFDIWKPWLIRKADQKWQGGFGTMLDDILAAIPAWIILQCLAAFWGEGIIKMFH